MNRRLMPKPCQAARPHPTNPVCATILILAMLAAVVSIPVNATPAARPNIVLIMVDDAGYSDIGAYGGEIETPNIDRLARNGVRFERFYTNAKCSPTRASLLTGQYPQRVGVGDLARPQDETPYPGYLGYLAPNNNVTIAEVLRHVGYTTLMSGKWHLGGENRIAGKPTAEAMTRWPTARGFDRFFGLIHGSSDYFAPHPPRRFYLDEAPYPAQRDKTFYATDAITDFAISFVRDAVTSSDAPFFLYVAYTAPHTPRQAPREVVDRYVPVYSRNWDVLQSERLDRLHKSGLVSSEWSGQPAISTELHVTPELIQTMALHAAMIDIVDRNVGRLMDTLREVGVADNTVVLFLSDNGAEWPVKSLASTPFRGEKAGLYEGGLVTPLIAYWPTGITQGGTIIRQPAHVIDIFPTIMELADAEYPPVLDGRTPNPLDGISFSEAFTTGSWSGRGAEPLHWDLYGNHAVISYPWKYVRDFRGHYHLYNLEHDGGETSDLAATEPVRLWRLAAMHASWASTSNVLPYEVVLHAQGRDLPREVRVSLQNVLQVMKRYVLQWFE